MLSEESGVATLEPEASEYIAYSERPETYIVPVLFGIIFLVGIGGNGCLMYILCRYKAMRSVPNTFVFNLALGDLLVLLCTVPFTSTVYTFESWPYGEFVCKASEFAKDTSVGVSVFTLTALSLDRYTAIARPVQSFVGGPKSKQVIITLAAIWAASLGLAVPAAMFSHLLYMTVPSSSANGALAKPTNHTITICYPFPVEFGPEYPRLVVILRVLLQYVLPLLIIGTFHVMMALHLLRSVKTIPGQATLSSPTSARQQRHLNDSKMEPPLMLQQHQPAQNRTRRKVAKMVVAFVVLFAICFLPMHIFLLWFYFDPNSQRDYNKFWHSVKIVGFVLAYINSCINPIALYCVSTSFRKHFNRILCCGSACTASGNTGSLSSGRFPGEAASNTAGSGNPRAGTRISKMSSSHNGSSRRRAVEEEVPLSEIIRP